MLGKVVGFKADLILEYLRDNTSCKDNAIKGKVLSELFNFNDGGDLRRVIHKLRMDGEPVLSCNKGYYYSTNKDEVLSMINNLYVRADGIFDIIRMLERVHNI